MSSVFHNPSGQIDLKMLKSRFAVPRRMAESAFLRREIADRMHERLALAKPVPARVLDAGCGEGDDLPKLQNRFPEARIFALDASHAMLRQAQKKQYESQNARSIGKICGNFARLPFAKGSFDMVWSNLALHWYPDPWTVFLAWREVLDEKGVLWFSCFGPETLSPLKEVFKVLDDYGHVLDFMEMHDLGDGLIKAGFPSPVLDREIITVTYFSAGKCLRDIQSFGGNVLMNRRRGMMGKNAFKKLTDLLEKRRNPFDGKIHMPFEIIYGHAFCAVGEAEKTPAQKKVAGGFHELKWTV